MLDLQRVVVNETKHPWRWKKRKTTWSDRKDHHTPEHMSDKSQEIKHRTCQAISWCIIELFSSNCGLISVIEPKYHTVIKCGLLEDLPFIDDLPSVWNLHGQLATFDNPRGGPGRPLDFTIGININWEAHSKYGPPKYLWIYLGYPKVLNTWRLSTITFAAFSRRVPGTDPPNIPSFGSHCHRTTSIWHIPAMSMCESKKWERSTDSAPTLFSLLLSASSG